jgi:hypothetical protein
VSKVGKLVLCCEDSWCFGDGGGSALGSSFGWTVWALVVGYVICSGGEGGGVCDGGLSGVTLACSGGIVVWLVIWRRVSVVVILVFGMGVGVLV